MSLDLRTIFSEIDEFQKGMGYDYDDMDGKERLAYARQCCLALFQEVAELTDSFKFADWKNITTDKENIEREIVDCIFFLHHIAKCFGISHVNLEQRYETVMLNNKNRYNKESK